MVIPANNQNQNVVDIKALSFAYNSIPILENVTLSIAPLDSICMVGPNGGGKTTLVKLTLGLLKPQAGTVNLFGMEPKASVLRVGYVPQYVHFDPQFPVTVLDVVLMGRLGHHFGGRYSKNDKECAMNALAEMHLTDIYKRPFSELSGGQRQRVFIARALTSTTEFLVLDEPTAYIDAATEANLFEMLTELNERMTVLVVTHDLGFASQFFKSVFCVNKQVVVHPTSEMTGAYISDIYGGDMRMIRHDHRCSGAGHSHE